MHFFNANPVICIYLTVSFAVFHYCTITWHFRSEHLVTLDYQTLLQKSRNMSIGRKRAIWKSRHQHLSISIGIAVGIGIGITKMFLPFQSFLSKTFPRSFWEFQLLFKAVILPLAPASEEGNSTVDVISEVLKTRKDESCSL